MSEQSIYTDCYKIVSSSDYFIYLFIGGRGIGKTYSMLRNSLDRNRIMYVRRTQTELDNCVNGYANPYKAINTNTGRNIYIEANKDSALILEKLSDGEEEKTVLHGYASALSTFGKFRGADFTDVDLIIFDEFINTSDKNTIKDESTMLFNMIETINRNRELEGQQSVKVVLLSNANTIDNSLIRTLELADKIQEMKEKDIMIYTDIDRGIYLALLNNDTVKDMKMKTRPYKLTKGTAFYDMALNNEFTKDYFGDVKKIQYQELTPVCNYGRVYFYKHKSKDIMLASYRKAQCEKFDDRTKVMFKRNYGYMMAYYIEAGTMLYADYNVKLDVRNIFR